MKLIQLITVSLILLFLSACDPNKPVQTSGELPELVTPASTPGSTPVKADSITANKKGPDQMVPENSTPIVTRTAMHELK